jgi:5-methylcytosine-specific restriction enzyme A
MAVAPRAFCLVTGCRARSVPGSRKCEAHRTAPAPKVAEAVYHSREWHAARARALRDNPWCAWCHATTGLSVDHIVPLSAGGGHEAANLRVLCLSCHGRRSAEQAHGRRGWVRPDGTREAGTEGAVARPYVQNLQRHGEGGGPGRSLRVLPCTPAPTTA